MKPSVTADLMWNMTRKCNFACRYCYHPHDHTPVDQVLDADDLVRLLDSTGFTWTVTLTGGEPFLYPGFVDICRCLTKRHFIEVDSNLSMSRSIRDFSAAVSPGRVKLIYASLHIEEREKRRGDHGGVGTFVKNVKQLTDKGFRVKVNYVAHPRVIHRFLEDRDRFRGFGIELVPRPFKGKYRGRRYPDAYGADARHIFSGQARAGTKTVFNFNGIPCEGGRRFVRLEPDGTFFRCSGDKRIIGRLGGAVRLNPEPEPCSVMRCPCRGLDHVYLTPAQQRFVDGIMYANVGDRRRAVEAFEATLEQVPEHPGVMNNLGVMAGRTGQREDADIFFSRALELRPASRLYRSNRDLLRSGDPEKLQLCHRVIP